MFPTIDLHTHIRGTIPPKMVRKFGVQNGVHVSPDAFDEYDNYKFGNFEEFLDLYDSVGRVVLTAEDLYVITKNYLECCAAAGTIYVELMFSPDHSADNGISFGDQFDALALGIEAARDGTGIEASIIATAVRHRGPDAAIDMAERLADLRHPAITGFGLTGNELKFDAKDFSGAFYVARDLGLGLTAHTGEWGDAWSVLETVDSLWLSRIGHGLSAIDDQRVLAELAEREIAFEICLSSNIRLGRCKEISQHPIITLLSAGCKVTLATDDPAYFSTTPEKEYEIAHRDLGLSPETLNSITANAVGAAFCDEATKTRLQAKLAHPTPPPQPPASPSPSPPAPAATARDTDR